MKSSISKQKPNGWALIPFLVFVVLFLGVGMILQAQGMEMAFYQFPAPIAILIAVALAFAMFKGNINEKMSDFLKGCGDENIMTMCCIYLLAGAFSAVAKAMGGVDATVNMGLSLIPAQYITAGIFVIASFLSVATGTSMGTISAMAPIAIGIAQKADLNMTLMIATVVGGAIFGDNLSMISDTTIAATRTQGVEMSDKFKVNFLIALPAAVITFILLLIFGRPETPFVPDLLDYNFIKVIPYVLVLGLALAGLNVFLTLVTGIVSAGVLGLFYGEFTFLTLSQTAYNGFLGMIEIFLLSMFTGGLAYMVTKNGGLQWALEKIQKLIKGKRSAEVGIAALASVADLATANNTVAIIVAGPIAKGISEEYKVDPRRSASLIDIWTCIFQGIIPYGAQILLIGSLTAAAGVAVSPLALFPYLWYQILLAIFAIVSIFIPYADGIIKKNPWNWEKKAAVENK